jgi:hypothetical protein
LAIGTLGEQVKTRLEVAREEQGAQDVEADPVQLPSGVIYQDLRTGGGSTPRKGDLVVVDYRCFLKGVNSLASSRICAYATLVICYIGPGLQAMLLRCHSANHLKSRLSLQRALGDRDLASACLARSKFA